MRRVGKAIATAVAVAVLAACGGTSGGDSRSQDQQQTVVTGRQACLGQWDGKVAGTTPDSDADDPADIICLLPSSQLVILDGEDGEIESDEKRYPYYEETDAGTYILAVWAAGKVIKAVALILKPPAGYNKPKPGQYIAPTRPGTTGGSGNQQRNGGTTSGTTGGTGNQQRNGGTTSGSSGNDDAPAPAPAPRPRPRT